MMPSVLVAEHSGEVFPNSPGADQYEIVPIRQA
jgi:hypothetical protein